MKHPDTKKPAIFNAEIYKIKPNSFPPILHHIFQFNENTLIDKFNLDLRNSRELLTHDQKTSNYGLETVMEHHFFGLNCHLNFKTQHLQANLKQK